MSIKIYPSPLIGEITVPSSKSVAHRALICAALGDDKCVLLGKFVGDDIAATIDCLSSLGAKIDVAPDSMTVYPIKTAPRKARIDARASGSTLRFMVSLCACFDTETTIVGSNRLAERPIKKLLDCLSEGGATFSSERLPITVKGILKSGTYYSDGSESSQFVSGLMLALPKIGGGKIVVTGKKVSVDYLKITASVMRAFGIAVTETDDGFSISGSYRSPKKYVVESDWSSAAFFAVAGAIGGLVTLKGLNPLSIQGDKKIINALLSAGAKIAVFGDNYRIEKGALEPFVFNVEDCPDCAPSLAVLAAFCNGKSVLTGTSRLKIKESDRGEETARFLSSFGVNAVNLADELVIYGTGKLSGAELALPDDHRIAMAAAIAASGSVGNSVLRGEHAVNKSYPSFFDDFILLGGKLDVLTV